MGAFNPSLMKTADRPDRTASAHHDIRRLSGRPWWKAASRERWCPRTATIAVLAMAVIGSHCPFHSPYDDFDQEVFSVEPPGGSRVASIEIIPNDIYVTPGSVFELRARLRDTDANILPPESRYQVEWQWEAYPLVLDPTVMNAFEIETSYDGPQVAIIRIPSTGSMLTPLSEIPTVRMRATVTGFDGFSDVSYHDYAEVTIVKDDHDQVGADHTPEDMPNVALLRYVEGSESRWRSLGFTDWGELGDLNDPAQNSELSAFSLRKEVGYIKAPIGWTTAKDIVSFATSPPPGALESKRLEPTVPITLRLWFASNFIGKPDYSAADVQQEAIWQIEAAVATFQANLTGVAFTRPTPRELSAVASIEIDPENKDDFPGIKFVHSDYEEHCHDFSKWLLGPVSAEFAEPALNIVYLESIGGFGGMACHHELTQTAQVQIEGGETVPMQGGLIFVGWLDKSFTTPAHELGHAMSLWGKVGHTLGIDGFERTNIMAGNDDTSPWTRDHISLGQAYRMTVCKWSWVNQAVQNPNASPAIAVRKGDTKPGCLTTLNDPIETPEMPKLAREFRNDR